MRRKVREKVKKKWEGWRERERERERKERENM